MLNQRREHRFVHRCELYQARVQTLQLRLRHGVEVHTRWVVLAGPLQPAQEDLRCARVCDRLLAQPALDLRVTRRLAATPGCAGASRTPCAADDRGGAGTRAGPCSRARARESKSDRARAQLRSLLCSPPLFGSAVGLESVNERLRPALVYISVHSAQLLH
jgi:hypothetical protein